MDKLEKVLKVRVQQEHDSAAALAQSRRARSEAEAQKQQLDELAEEYRRQHQQAGGGSVHRFRQFYRFYGQLTSAVDAQRDVVAKLAEAEAGDAATFVGHHKDRRALEELLQQRDLAHKTKRLRAERRAQNQPRKKPMV